MPAVPAFAHGLGGRTDLPIPVWQFAWAASFAVTVSFFVLGRFWTAPRMPGAAAGKEFPEWVQRAGRMVLPATRIIGLLGFGTLLYAALRGNIEVASNIAPYAFFILFWVGGQLLSAVLGDVWAGFNPLSTLAETGAWALARYRRTSGRRPALPLRGATAATAAQQRISPRAPASSDLTGAGAWAVGSMCTFVWMELAFHRGADPRSIGAYLVVYSAVMLVVGARRGRRWVRSADGFGALFGALSSMAPFHRDHAGVWRRRVPLAGLAGLEAVPGSVRLVLVVIGAATFDGFSRSSLWLEVVSNRSGWDLTLVNSGGLLFGIGAVMAVYRAAVAAMARITGDAEAELGEAFGPSLVPIAVAYTIAHYFSFLALDGQAIIRLVSDPFGAGWDLFGTAGYRIDYTLVSPAAIAWIQTTAIGAGHVLAIIVAHDRALERYPRELVVRSQYPMLTAMVTFTLAGLFLLLGG